MSESEDNLADATERESDPCPCCGYQLHVGHRIYCLRGCVLIWTDWDTLDEDDDSYPKPCPHVGDEVELDEPDLTPHHQFGGEY